VDLLLNIVTVYLSDVDFVRNHLLDLSVSLKKDLNRVQVFVMKKMVLGRQLMRAAVMCNLRIVDLPVGIFAIVLILKDVDFVRIQFMDLSVKRKKRAKLFAMKKNGTWKTEVPSNCSGTPTPGPNPIPPCQFSTFCDCTKSFECGWCSGYHVIEGVNKSWAYCKIIKVIDGNTTVYGETVCHQNGGTWAKGTQEVCKPPTNDYHVAVVEGTLNTKPNETTTQIIAAVIQSFVSQKLGIAPEKVQVTVSVTDNADGTTTFKVTVKVATSVVTEGAFDSGVDSIVSSNLQSSIQNQGVDVKSIGSITPVNNFAGKLFVSLLVALMIVWM